MEYSKEDLMEAKKQIWGVGENMGTEESKKIWEKNAQFWDNAMGDKSNEFHREVVRPKVTELLSPNPADYILDGLLFLECHLQRGGEDHSCKSTRVLCRVDMHLLVLELGDVVFPSHSFC